MISCRSLQIFWQLNLHLPQLLISDSCLAWLFRSVTHTLCPQVLNVLRTDCFQVSGLGVRFLTSFLVGGVVKAPCFLGVINCSFSGDGRDVYSTVSCWLVLCPSVRLSCDTSLPEYIKLQPGCPLFFSNTQKS